MSAYKFGQFVRSTQGHPARATGNGNACVYIDESGGLAMDSVRQEDVTVRSQHCPTVRQLENFLKTRQNDQPARDQGAEAKPALTP